MMKLSIDYADNPDPKSVIQIWEDLHTERPGYFRAFWCSAPEADTGSPVVGYCSAGGSYRTIRATAARAHKLFPHDRIYRNGKDITPSL